MPRILLAVSLLLGVWIGWQEMPREIARWYLAAAVEHYGDAQHHRRHARTEEAEQHAKTAQAAMQQALNWNPQFAEALAIRADWHRQEERFQDALDDCNRALELTDSPAALLEQRSTIFLAMKRYREAVEDQLAIYQPMRSWSRLTRWWLRHELCTQLNQTAYIRAVGQQDLPQALSEINEALAGLKKPTDKLSEEDLDDRMMLLDTRGYILYLLDRPKEAINDMDEAAKLASDKLKVLTSPEEWRYRLHAALNLREFEQRESRRRYSLAVIFYHRSLVLDKLKHKKDAAEDRKLATDLLGREPDESVF